MEDVDTVLVEDVGGPQHGDLVEEGKLVFVDQVRGREGARQEVEGWSRSAGVEALESLQSQSSMGS